MLYIFNVYVSIILFYQYYVITIDLLIFIILYITVNILAMSTLYLYKYNKVIIEYSHL